MDKMEINNEINITEEKLMDILEQLLCDNNIDRLGDDNENFIHQVSTYIEHNVADEDVVFTLSDYCTELGNRSSTYGFKLGFKEGVRLFRTLMKL